VWYMFPYSYYNFNMKYGVLMVLFLLGISSFPILLVSWFSDCKYSLSGGLRGVAQLVSYEVNRSFFFFSLCFIVCCFIVYKLRYIGGLILLRGLPLFLVWLPSCLAEINRTPFDFSEGESELVSGFNTELGGGPFALFFIGEYISIIFISLISFFIFFVKGYLFMLLGFVFFCFFLVCVRSLLPRFRYDILISFCWKDLLPFSVWCFFIYRCRYFLC